MSSVTTDCFTVNESTALTLEQSRPSMVTRKLDGSQSFCSALAGPVTLPEAFVIRLYSGANFSVRFAGSFDAPSSAEWSSR